MRCEGEQHAASVYVEPFVTGFLLSHRLKYTMGTEAAQSCGDAGQAHEILQRWHDVGR